MTDGQGQQQEGDGSEDGKPLGPRDVHGAVVGPGGPDDRNGVIVDATQAVIVDGLEVTMIEAFRQGQSNGPSIAVLIEGRINKTRDRASFVCLVNEDGAAAFVTEIVKLATRSAALAPEFLTSLQRRLTEM